MSDNYLAAFEGYLIGQDAAEKTIKAYLGDLRQFNRWLGERAGSLADMTPTDLRDYRQSFGDRAPSTFNRKLVAIKRYTAWAVDCGLIERDPAKGIKSLKQVRPAPRKLSDSDVRALTRAIEKFGSDRDKAIVTLMLNTGLRVSEVCGLKVSDVELRERSGRLTIRGKGNKTRIVPLNLAAREDLAAYLGSAEREYVFMADRDGRGRLHARGLSYMLAKYSRLAQIDRVNPHALRHRFAYQLRKTESIEVVGRLLGHESITTTAIYTEPTRDDLQEAVEQLGGSPKDRG